MVNGTYVRKPIKAKEGWVVQICESSHPFAKVIESIPSDNYVNAFEVYRHVMRDLGRNL